VVAHLEVELAWRTHVVEHHVVVLAASGTPEMTRLGSARCAAASASSASAWAVSASLTRPASSLP